MPFLSLTKQREQTMTVGKPAVQEKLAAQDKRLRAEVKALRKQLHRLREEMGRLRLLIDDGTFRLARRVARLEAASPAVQCQDGW
jgi:ABC-type phosphate transport system auxiliary subunit